MLNLNSAFEIFPVELDGTEPTVDTDFITDFLMPYFGDLQRDELAAKVLEIIGHEQQKLAAVAARRTANTRAED